jgi:hypothetical protein
MTEKWHAKAQFGRVLTYKIGGGALYETAVAPPRGWIFPLQRGLNSLGKSHDNIAKEMAVSLIAKAQKLARECLAKNYKRC